MITIHAKTKQELLTRIQDLPASADGELYLSKRPTLEIMRALLQCAPNIKAVSCPQSLYKQVAKKTFSSFEDTVCIRAGGFAAGRPPLHTSDAVQSILAQRAAGKTAKQIACDSHIPLRTVYYYLAKAKKA